MCLNNINVSRLINNLNFCLNQFKVHDSVALQGDYSFVLVSFINVLNMLLFLGQIFEINILQLFYI